MDLSFKKRATALFTVVVLGYLTATWICFTKSEYIVPTAATHIWRQAAEVLAFPMVYLDPRSDSDWLLVLILLNSAIWSTLLTSVVLLLSGQMRRRAQVGP